MSTGLNTSANCQCVVLPFFALFPSLPVRRRTARWNTASTAPAVLSQDKLDALATIKTELERALERIDKRDNLSDRVVMVLTGAAGTGKTTLMRAVADLATTMGFSVLYAAPTGKAASRLRDLTGQPASTIHRLLMGAPTEMGVCPSCGKASADLGFTPREVRKRYQSNYTCPECRSVFPLDANILTELHFEINDDMKSMEPKTLLIIDEASMIGTQMYNNILAGTSNYWPILFVGDREQLEPVGDTWGPNFEKPTANLTEVHRQVVGNPILNLATRIRTKANRAEPWAVDEDLRKDNRLIVSALTGYAEPARWLAAMRQEKKDATLIAPYNKMRRRLNEAVRRARGLTQLSIDTGSPVVRGDRLVVLQNHYSSGVEMMNGEVFIVNRGVNGPDVYAELEDENGVVTRSAHPTVWVQLFPRAKWYLLAVESLTNDQFTWRHNKDLFDSVLSQDYEYAKELADAADRNKPARLPAGLGELYNKLTQAREETAKKEEEILKSSMTQLEKANALGQLENVPRLLSDYIIRYKALPRSAVLYADYGECLTCHKAQGSQWKNVGLVVPERLIAQYQDSDAKVSDAARRWLYTAVTRAAENLRVWSSL